MATVKRRGSRNSITPNHKIINKLLDFLDSSVWHLPVETFIEQQSIVFDRQQDDSELYMKVHIDFGNLVDTLLECFCEDTNIQPEELVCALEKVDREKLSAKAKASFEPLAAAQNYNVFVTMMMRKNVELQLQALQMIEFMCGLIPSVLQLEEGETLKDRQIINLSGEDAEKYVLMAVLKQSKAEYDSVNTDKKHELESILRVEDIEKDRNRLIAEDAAIVAAMTKQVNDIDIRKSRAKEEPIKKEVAPPSRGQSRQERSMSTTSNGSNGLKVERKVSHDEQKRPQTSDKKAITNERKPSIPRPNTAKKGLSRKSSAKSRDEETSEKKGRTAADIRALLGPADQLDAASLAERTAYLNAQRKKLMMMKQLEREKQLNQVSGAIERPKTAKAARGLMRGGKMDKRGDDIMAARRAIVDKLKESVQ